MEIETPPHSVRAEPGTEAFTDGYRLLAEELASGVAVVAARHRRRDHAVTVTGWLDISYDPPTMAVSLFDEARICEAVESSPTWTLSVLRREQESTATWLASPGNPVDGLLDGVGFRRSPVGGAAVLDGALAWFELETQQIHPAATHMLVVGRVVAMGRGGEQGASTSQGQAGPLVHWGRGFHGLNS